MRTLAPLALLLGGGVLGQDSVNQSRGRALTHPGSITGPYRYVTSGHCNASWILTRAQCESAAAALGDTYTTAAVSAASMVLDTRLAYHQPWLNVPPYCVRTQGLFFFSAGSTGACTTFARCICWTGPAPSPSPPPPSLPPSPPMICVDTCPEHSGNGVCEDGGSNSFIYPGLCAYGSDCFDW